MQAFRKSMSLIKSIILKGRYKILFDLVRKQFIRVYYVPAVA